MKFGFTTEELLRRQPTDRDEIDALVGDLMAHIVVGYEGEDDGGKLASLIVHLVSATMALCETENA